MPTSLVEPRYLVPLSGPPLRPLQLTDKPGGLTAGRHEASDLLFPADVEHVSRTHARFNHDNGRWLVTDLGSRWGTFVNGMKLAPQSPVGLRDGDLIRITPWTFTFSPTAQKRGMRAADDSNMTQVRTVGAISARPLAESMLTLLLEGTAGLHGAPTEKELAELLIDLATRGTGLQNAAVLRPVDAAGTVELLCSKCIRAGEPMNFSRSLIAAASNGDVAEINAGAGGGNISQSIVQLQINTALCVPLMLGPAVAAYLYLDSRGTLISSVQPNASAFCVALGKIASLALANLKRGEMEKRDAAFKAELAAAAAAQRWIMPRRECSHGRFNTIGESKPGQYVGGDFFDIVQLGKNHLAVAVADVSGKGVSASVLMTATQGFLNAALRDCLDPGQAVTSLNKFVYPRRPANRFVTAWVGVFNGDTRELRYVDAGHSYALLQRANGSFEQLDKGSGLPIGIDEDSVYQSESITFDTGDQVVVVSDGIIEQPSAKLVPGSGDREQFEIPGIEKAMTPRPTDPIAALFAAVIAHAGSDQLADDATAVLVRMG